MNYNKVDLSFQSCDKEYEESSVVLFSAPLDTTTSYRPGTRFAGNAIRVESIGIEWYSPYKDMDLKDYKTADIGDLEIPMGDVKTSLDTIYNTSKNILKDHKKVMMIGGEHLVTYPVVKAYHEVYPDLKIIHLDAHTDLRDEFLGMKLSHATVIKRCYDILGDNRIYQFGIRSGYKHEFQFAKDGHTYMEKFSIDTLEKIIDEIKDSPVYITIDLDVLDPSVMPGTGTPEPGGISFKEILHATKLFEKLNHVVGADIVELAPKIDPTDVSTAVAAKLLREMILLLHK
ncbi:agmatinase [Hujiaoplasma nucleasis]|uniref:Agmatinase n=1 Tax=Hujiaoplasma nucleasis TaxID=2725268 RepID=A0A7L6N8Q9_9MOLU|nr:agmatinase [Hujiaoplasma nucleasis]QLY40909.1 agmatinase [Hujiaoplasma nucleasis]